MKYFRALFVIVVLTILVLSIVRIVKAENNLLGTGAGGVLTTGHSNTILGEAAGMTISTGIGNIFIGYGAGHGTTTGSGNVYLGYMAGYAKTTSDYNLVIQHYRYPTYGMFGIFSSGRFGINKVTPTRAFDVTGSVGADSVVTTNFSATTSSATTYTFPNGETIDNSVNGTIRMYGRTIAAGDSHAITSETVTTSVSEVDTSAVVFVGGKANVYGSDGDTYSIGITTGDAANFTGAGGGYLFDGGIDGTDILNTTIGVGGASSGAFTTLSATTSLNYVADVLAVTTDATLTAAMSGRIITNTGSANGDSLFLPTCASGLLFEIMSSEADSIIIQCATGDSIFDAASLKPSTSGAAANQSITLVGIPTAGTQFNWIVKSKTGTWTGN